MVAFVEREAHGTPFQLRPLRYGPYIITKAFGENAFELSIPPMFLVLHPVFNVELLHPYFPPLLDTSDVAESLAPKKINPNYLEYATIGHIMDTNRKGTHQQHVQLYRVVKVKQFLHQGKWLTRSQIQQKFPHFLSTLDAMDTIAS